MSAPRTQAQRLRNFAARPLARNVGKVLTGNLAGNALNMLAMAILSRALGLTLFGVFSILQNTMMFIGQFADFGLNTTIVKYYQQYAQAGRKDKAEALMRHALWLRLGVLALMVGLGCVFAGPLAHLLIKDMDATTLMRIACAGAAGYALWMFCQAAMQAREQFGQYALLGTANHGLRLILIVGLILAGVMTLGHAVWIMVAVPVVGAISAMTRWPALFWSARMEREELKSSTSEIFRFSKWIFISSATTSIIMRLDLFMLGAMMHDGGVQAGHFSRASLFALVFPQISAAVSTVLLPRLASTRDVGEVRRMSRKILGFVPLLAIATVGVMLGAEWFFPWFYGPEARLSAHVFSALAAGMMFSIVLNPLSFFFMAFDKPQWLTQMNVMQLVLNVGVNLLLIPWMGALGAAFATLAVRGFAVIYLWWGFRKLMAWAEDEKSSA